MPGGFARKAFGRSPTRPFGVLGGPPTGDDRCLRLASRLERFPGLRGDPRSYGGGALEVRRIGFGLGQLRLHALELRPSLERTLGAAETDRDRSGGRSAVTADDDPAVR